MCRLWLRCAHIRVVRGRRYRLDVIEGDGSRSIVVRNNTRLEVPVRQAPADSVATLFFRDGIGFEIICRN